MHQTVFLGWGFLISLAGIIGLSAYKKIDYTPLMVSFVLTLGGAMVGAFLLGSLLAGKTSMSSIGAIFGGGLMMYVALHFFRPKPFDEAIDVLVSSSFLGLLVTRVGCLSNQCDFGAPTDFFWGISYKIGPIWQYHRVLGINDGLESHAVHPFPWMIVIPGAILFAVVWAKDIRRKTEVIVYGYLAIRFFAEFFRDASTSVSVWGVQVGLILTAIIFGLVHRFAKNRL